MENIQKYDGKSFHKTYSIIGNIDGVEPLDTIRTTITVKFDSVYVNSIWEAKGVLLWHEELVDPYLYVSDHPVFKYGNIPIWTRLTIAENYSIPEMISIVQFKDIPEDMVVYSGLSQLQKLDAQFTKEVYKKYLESFKGELIAHGEPELNIISIWYGPKKVFVPFYQP